MKKHLKVSVITFLVLTIITFSLTFYFLPVTLSRILILTGFSFLFSIVTFSFSHTIERSDLCWSKLRELETELNNCESINRLIKCREKFEIILKDYNFGGNYFGSELLRLRTIIRLKSQYLSK